MDTKLIPLTKGKFAIVDAEDFEWLNQWKWYYGAQGYAVRHTDKKHIAYMHREILQTPKGLVTDHANRNKLDNRESNLRVCNTSQNLANRPKQINNSSGFKGVFFFKQGQRTKRWKSAIKIKDEYKQLGYFLTKEEAALAYNQKAKELFGEFAYLNQI
jgi:hypothetical protein